MNWDGNARTLKGLVPVTNLTSLQLTVIATNNNGLYASATFTITFISGPYLATALVDYSIRTDLFFSASIPKSTFLSPSGDLITYLIT